MLVKSERVARSIPALAIVFELLSNNCAVESRLGRNQRDDASFALARL